MKKRFINLLCFLMLFVVVIAQETSQTTMNVTLQEARDYAIRNNRSMQNASLEVRKDGKQSHLCCLKRICRLIFNMLMVQ